MNFELRNEQKNRLLKIRELYINKKYEALIKEANIYLNIYPNEINVRFMRAKAYRKQEMFKEAIKDLKYNLSLEDNEHSLVELYYLYYYLNMYKEAIELLPKLYDSRSIIATSLVISEKIKKKSLGIPVKTRENNYTINQINNYSDEAAIEHIKLHTEDVQNNDVKKRSRFKENINIKYLYDIVRKSINNAKKANVQEILEVHYFAISNVGYSDNNTCNFIKVVVIPSTNNIISIYPVDDILDSKFMHLECDRNKLFEKKEEKVKTKSRIDRFKERYNM